MDESQEEDLYQKTRELRRQIMERLRESQLLESESVSGLVTVVLDGMVEALDAGERLLTDPSASAEDVDGEIFVHIDAYRMGVARRRLLSAIQQRVHSHLKAVSARLPLFGSGGMQEHEVEQLRIRRDGLKLLRKAIKDDIRECDTERQATAGQFLRTLLSCCKAEHVKPRTLGTLHSMREALRVAETRQADALVQQREIITTVRGAINDLQCYYDDSRRSETHK